jgi:hypothetical protein
MNLQNFLKHFVLFSSIVISACATRPDSVTPLDVSSDQYEGYTCSELKQIVTKLADIESKLVEEMDSTANNQVAANILGGALLAVSGVGFTTTVNNSSYGSSLAKVRGHLNAARAQEEKMRCNLPEAQDEAKTNSRTKSRSKVRNL